MRLNFLILNPSRDLPSNEYYPPVSIARSWTYPGAARHPSLIFTKIKEGGVLFLNCVSAIQRTNDFGWGPSFLRQQKRGWHVVPGESTNALIAMNASSQPDSPLRQLHRQQVCELVRGAGETGNALRLKRLGHSVVVVGFAAVVKAQ